MAIRAVNSGGVATTNIMVRGVNIGNATAGYTTLSAALSAASGGDTIVFTENFEVTGSHVISINLTLTADDASWFGKADSPNKHEYGTGARISAEGSGNDTIIINNSAVVTIERLQLESNNDTGTGGFRVVETSDLASLDIRACTIHKLGTGEAVVAESTGGGDSSISAEFVFCQLGAAADGFENSTSTNGAIQCRHVAVVRTDNTAIFCFNGSSANIEVVNCYGGNGEGLTTTSSVYNNCVTPAGFAAGHNGSSNAADAPGSVTYDNTNASEWMKSSTAGSLNAHFKDVYAPLNFGGIDDSSILIAQRDIDDEALNGTDYYMGPDDNGENFDASGTNNLFEFQEPNGAALADQIASDDTWSLAEFMTPNPSGTSNPVKTVYILEVLLSSGTKANSLFEMQPPDGDTIFDVMSGYLSLFQQDGFTVEFGSPNPLFTVTDEKLRTVGAFDGQGLLFVGLDAAFENWVEFHVYDTQQSGIIDEDPQNLFEGMTPQEPPIPPVPIIGGSIVGSKIVDGSIILNG